MKNIYAAYLKERENIEIVETDISFATYKISGNELFIKDLYVNPKYRSHKAGYQLAETIVEIGKNRGCKYLIATLCPSAEGSNHALKLFLRYGMKLLKSQENLIYFAKEI